MLESKTISVSIQCPPPQVYQFSANPENLPQWASGLGTAITIIDGTCVAQTSQGVVKIRFAPPNDFGILDHYVTLPSGQEIYAPLRVIANGTGSELIFTLFRQVEMSAQQFHDDAEWAMRDLTTLKQLLENKQWKPP
ncbi:MAG: SRPBCC family protein [Pseudomonadota bacterium]